MPSFIIMKIFWLTECLSQFKPKIYRRYVHNIFVLFKCKEHLKLFLSYINSKHKNIKFTFETEDLNNFSFLDVKITPKNKLLFSLIFRKATFSIVFTNYHIFPFTTYKIGLVHTLMLRFILFQDCKFSYRSRTPEKYFQMQQLPD